MKTNFYRVFGLFVTLALATQIFGCGSNSSGGGSKSRTVQFPPIFLSSAPTVAQIGITYTYNIAVTDVDTPSNDLTIEINLHDTCLGNLTDNGDGTGFYTFMPDAAQVNTDCEVGLTASDGKLSTDQSTTVHIGNENAAPYFTSTAPTTATEDVPYTYNITVADGNVPPQPLTITLGTIDTCGGVVADNGDGTGTYSFTPSENEGGIICLISLTVTDSMAASVDQNTLVTIAEDNKPPVNNAPASATGNELTLISFNINPTDPDIPAQALTCSIVTNNCPGGALNGCSFEWTPTEAQGPTACTVITRVSDGALANDATTMVIVNEVNAAPVNNAPANVSGNELTLISFNINPTDPDIPAQALTCSIVTNNCPGGVLNSCSFEWTPTEAQGPIACTVITRVSDGTLTNDATTMVIVNEVNAAPVNNAPANVSGNELSLISFNINPTDADIPAQALTCSIMTNNCPGGALNGCSFEWTPTEAQGPTACTVTTRVSDGALANDATTTVTVNEVNVAPTNNAPANVSGNELSLISFNINPTDADIPAQTLTCSIVTNNCPGGALNGCAFEWTPTEAQGPIACTVTTRVSDGALANDATTMVIVNEVNVAPVNNAPANVSGNELTLISFNINPTDPDIPAQALTCSIVTNNCPGGALNGCSFEWTPTEAQGPTACTVTTRVSDGTLTSNATTTVTVNEVNQAPVWSAVPANLSVVTGQTYNSINGSATDADLPAQTLTCSGLNSTCSFTINVGGSGASPRNCSLSFTAGTNPETCGVDVQVSDGAGGIITQNIMISVQQCRIFVDHDATGSNNGSSWKNAYNVIEDAVNASWAGCEIWVAEGNYYKKTAGTSSVLTMKNGVRIYGGFVGTESNLGERLDPADYPTYLDGEDTGYHVIVGASNARLDGFYITGGNANGSSSPYYYGGGMYNSNITNLIIINNTFIENSAIGGGGIFNISSSATITNCMFFENSVESGGGIYNDSSSPTITDCVFSGNPATLCGGGICNFNFSSPTISNCAFSGNSSESGGGIGNVTSSPTIINSSFSANSVSVYGGGIANSSSSPTITNCTFSGNSASYDGGGIRNYQSSPTISNCTFSENAASGYGGGIDDNSSSSPTVSNCIFSENSSSRGGGIFMNNSSPTITNCAFSENSTSDSGGGIYINHSSPTITNCIFSENSASAFGGGIFNFDSYSTVTNCAFSENSAMNGGGIYNVNVFSTDVTNITNCTFSGNSATNNGGGIYNDYSSPIVTNCIIWGNTASNLGPSIRNNSSTPTVTYSDVQGGYGGTGNIASDPLFATGTFGNYYLSQTAAGQGSDSPCLNAGSATAASLGLDTRTTRTDNVADSGTVDMGYHYPIP